MSNQNSFVHPVQFDQLNIDTPEQVELRFPVAGIGSRFLAVAADTLLVFGFYVLLVLVAYITSSGKSGVAAMDRASSTAQNWWMAAFIFINFLIVWGYFALFEAFWNGQTPGKRLVKIRVIKDSGRAITLFEALARNLLRVVDYLPGMYAVGLVTMLCNKSQKRLGDLVAGTIVVHEQTDEQPLLTHHSRTFTANIYKEDPAPSPFGATRRNAPWARQRDADEQALPQDAVARLKAEDLHLIETFFNRALDLTVEKRAQLAERAAATVSGRMGIAVPVGMAPERMLELVAHQMRANSRF